jgi:hypothetical protein
VFVLICAAAGAVLAVPAAWLWSVVADAPEGVLFDGEVFFDEGQLNVETSMTLWFMVIGVLVGLVAGLVVGLVGHRHGVGTVVAVVVLCSVTSILMEIIGGSVFGPDEAAQVAQAEQGGAVTGALAIGTWVAYLACPVGGLVGVLASIAGWPHDTGHPERSDGGNSPQSGPS